jgi:hypothetical protein
MEDVREYRIDEENEVSEKDGEYEAATREEVPFHIPRD